MSIERPAIHGIRKRTAPVTLSVASDDWLKLKKPTWAKKSYEVEERNLKHLKPALGSLLLIDISAEDIADYQKSRLKANASPKTINDGPECSSRRHHDGLGIAKSKAGVTSRFHDLRHTACTRLLERGASLSVVASIMGWSASTTAKMAERYGHIGSEVQRAALDALVQTPKQLGADATEEPASVPDSTRHS